MKRDASSILLPVLLLAGCTVGPDFHTPAAPDAKGWTREPLPTATASATGPGGGIQTFATAEHTPRAWWTQFGSAELNALVDQA